MVTKKLSRGQKMKEGKAQLASKNGKKPEGAGGSSFFTWFMVLALLGVWTSVAVVYFDLVDYQGVIVKAKDMHITLSETLQGKLSSYDADGDGDFDVEDAKVLLDEPRRDRKRVRHRGTLPAPPFSLLRHRVDLVDTESPKTKVKKNKATEDEKPGHVAKREAQKEHPLTKDVGWKLREALKQQLAIIHERVEAKKIAKMALAEVRNILAREEEEKVLGVTRDESAKKAKVAVAARMKEEEEKIEKEEFEKALEKIRRDKEQEEEKGKKHKKEKKPEKKSGKEAEAVGQKAEAPKEAKSKEAPKASAKKLKVSDKGVRK
ncbi:vicilin-like seed storage protein At2g18540 isoform X2 [Coregonus clupeaformis]|uniref:vicilin-like seed storage protein At2g18540 isoform X2 n=1 Tax=Coregonus clupeaformis TaxID=59861 RepID=UPI001E1C76AB|nr:vicilin-like seed storage protein At2g18540 isoform X2 [Coregonus clupeaformis]